MEFLVARLRSQPMVAANATMTSAGSWHPRPDALDSQRCLSSPHMCLGPGLLRGCARPQLAAFFTSAPIRASSAGVNFISAKAVGHILPSSRRAASLKPSVAYLVLNFWALWKKQTILPSLAYAGMPYQVFGELAVALALMSAWSRFALS